MFKRRLACLLAALSILAWAGSVSAAEVSSDTVYCFSAEEFGEKEETLTGICVTGLPDSDAGTVLLGTRVVRPGDILTADQLAMLTFAPLRTETDREAALTYLPIYESHVAPSAVMTLSIRGREDKAPVAEDFALETYKNLPNEGTLKARDPEGERLTYTVTRQPRRGEVTIREDGTFTYTPKKNKVGTDSFTFTAADPAGNVSREATVTVQILKPRDAGRYADTVGEDCRFEAEWLKNTGIFEAESIGGAACFQPDKAVSAGEFLTMMIRVLEIPAGDAVYSAVPADTPGWLKPYVAAAIRSGLTADIPEELSWNDGITGAEAAVLLQGALDLTVSTDTDLQENADSIPAWAVSAVNALADNSIPLEAEAVLTRAQVAQILYRVSKLAADAPGMAVLRAR